MKIYAASSWRNELQPSIVVDLRELGHEVYDDRAIGTYSQPMMLRCLSDRADPARGPTRHEDDGEIHFASATECVDRVLRNRLICSDQSPIKISCHQMNAGCELVPIPMRHAPILAD
jgi:hypothetical protein